MRTKVSLKDIAQKVGVSTALVSYVLNNQKVDRINKQLAQKIKETAIELNYRTNHIARSLKTNKTFTIGLIVSNISNPFSSALARIIEDEAGQQNYTVLFSSSDENEHKSLKLINVFLDHQVDGLIIAPTENASSQLSLLMENEIPFVLIDRYFPDVKCNYVAIDNFKASYSITRHMIENGAKRIGLVTYKSTLLHLQERKKGYTAALKENKLPSKKMWIKEISNGNEKTEIEAAIDQLTSSEESVDAILFASNIISSFGLKFINSLSLKVPEQIMLASFDETEASELFYAPLTYIKQPLEQIGKLATNILLNKINKPNNELIQVKLEAELVTRKSTQRKKTKM